MPEQPHAITFPCYAIMNQSCTGGVVLRRQDGSVALALFRSEGTLRRFRAANASQKVWGPSVKCDGENELLLYLDALPPVITHVGVDPDSTGSTAFSVSVSQLKAEIRRQLDLTIRA